MNYILFDTEVRNNLLPFTYTRPVSEIRTGILTITQKWEKYLDTKVSFLTKNYLQKKFPLQAKAENILINGSIIPDKNLLNSIKNLGTNEILHFDNKLIALKINSNDIPFVNKNINGNQTSIIEKFKAISYENEFTQIKYTWDIFGNNGAEIEKDFKLLTEGRKSQPLSNTVQVLGQENIFLEEGAKVEFATLNASDGYIYLGKDSEIMEGAVVRGSLALCEHSMLKISSKIYGPTSIGPHSKVGGEVNNAVIFGYSNKGHDGFLGNSVLGEWCNIGADTNTSNLKNNYANVKVWNYDKKRFMNTGLQFCGLLMGDHSKCGINTMFNTGTMVGVFANIYGAGFPRNFVPSFAWGGAMGFQVYLINKAFEVAERVMARRNIEFDETEQEILEHVFELTSEFRRF